MASHESLLKPVTVLIALQNKSREMTYTKTDQQIPSCGKIQNREAGIYTVSISILQIYN